jgi:hypothetical protein
MTAQRGLDVTQSRGHDPPMPPTLVLPPRFTADSNAVRGAALQAGWRIERLSSWRVEGPIDDPVLYGEPLFAAVVAPQVGLALLEPPLDWLPTVPERHLGRRVEFMTLAEARVLPGPVFVKPADEKAFDARVWASGKELPGPETLPDYLAVLVAEPIEWSLEVRCFVVDGEVVACSPYVRHRELAQVEDGSWPATADEFAEARVFAGKVLADVAMPPAVALDVGIITGRGWAVVEANPCWGSGVYGCDPAGVLRAAQRASVPADRVPAADARWVVKRRGDQAP